MKFRDYSETKRAEMQLAPMIDVVFLLLIFFIVSWNYAQFESEVDISVPAPDESEQPPEQIGEVVLHVQENGDVVMNNLQVTLDELYQRLSSVSEFYPGLPVILRGDEETPFEYIMNVMDTCQKADIWNVAFAEVPTPPASEGEEN